MWISIITPIYNGESYVKPLIQSFLELDCSLCELIIIDDGSTDKTLENCYKYCNHPYIRIIHKENGGVSSARNLGVKEARGEWICFLDCDDKPKSYMYNRLLNCTNINYDFVMGGYEKVGNDFREPISIHFNGIVHDVKEVIFSMAFWNGVLNDKRLNTLYGSVWPNMYKKEIIDKYNIVFPEEIKLGEDLLFNLEYLKHVNCIYAIDEPLYEYNVTNESATRKMNPLLWKQYSELNNRISKSLYEHYRNDDNVVYNVYKQYISFAISVIQEQIFVFVDKKERKQALKRLCHDGNLKQASMYIIKYGKTVKERIQAYMFYCNLTGLIRLWLDR